MKDIESRGQLSPQEVTAQALYGSIDEVYRHPKFRNWMFWEDVDTHAFDYGQIYEDDDRNLINVDGKKVYISVSEPHYAGERGKFRADSLLTFNLELEPRFDYKMGDEPSDVYGYFQVNRNGITRNTGVEQFELTNPPYHRSYSISPDLKPQPLGEEHLKFVSNCLSVLKSTLDNYTGPTKSPLYRH